MHAAVRAVFDLRELVFALRCGGEPLGLGGVTFRRHDGFYFVDRAAKSRDAATAVFEHFLAGKQFSRFRFFFRFHIVDC
jgi:hypothetical protein